MVTSSRRQVFGVMSFTASKGGYGIEPAVPARGENDAKRLADRLAEKRAGAVAFYRVGDPDIGEFDEPVVVYQVGTVPYDVRDLYQS